jgi:diguanylate cyclase (GGDEF)-like protein
VAQIFPYRLAIRDRLILLSLGVAAPLLLIIGFALWKEYSALRTQGFRTTSSQTAIAAQTLHEWIWAQLDTVKSLAALPTLKQLSTDSCLPVAQAALRSQRSWKEIAIITPGGYVVAPATVPPSNVPEKISWPSKELYTRICVKRQLALTGYIKSPLTGRPILLAGAPIVRQNKVRGALLVGIDPQSVLKLFKGLGEDEGTVITVVDKDKRIIARTLDDEHWAGVDYSQAHTMQAAGSAGKSSLEAVCIADRVPRTYSFERVPELNWFVIVGIPVSTIYSAADQWAAIIIMFTCGALAVSLLLAFLATSHFTRNIGSLVREALALGRGDLSKRVKITAEDELGTLAKAFNEMATRLELDHQQKFMIERLSESIRQSLDLEQILNTTVRELGKALEASRCCIALIDEHAKYETGSIELVFDHVWCNPDHGGLPLAHRSILVTPKSVMSLMLEQGSILSLDLLEENSSTPLFENRHASPEDWNSIKSLIACPISGDNGPVGIILIHQCDRPRAWTEAELELVDAVSRHVVLAMHHARLYNRTKNMAEQEMLINHIVRSVRSSLDLDTILNTVTQELAIALQADRCQIAQPRPEGPLVITHEFHAPNLPSVIGLSLYSDSMDFNPGPPNEPVNNGRNFVLGIDLTKITTDQNGTVTHNRPQGDVSFVETLKEAPIAVIHDTRIDSRTLPFRTFIAKSNARSIIAAPLISENRLVGLLIVHQCREYRFWKPREIQLVAAIADQLAIAIAHAHLFAQVRYQAITDGLTGLYNHVYFKNRLGEELRMAQRKGTACSLLMIDLDNLKHINDTYGHPVGDAAIRQVAAILKTLLRSGDTPARYGGEEFGVILPETSLLEAALIADRLCAQISNCHVPGLGKITASIGAAAYPRQGKDMRDLVEKADRALYAAKNSGRNKISVYDETEYRQNREKGSLQRVTLSKSGESEKS